jgi:hypothetical protein
VVHHLVDLIEIVGPYPFDHPFGYHNHSYFEQLLVVLVLLALVVVVVAWLWLVCCSYNRLRILVVNFVLVEVVVVA